MPSGTELAEQRRHLISNLKALWPDDRSHPWHIVLRTYSLSLLLSLGPSVFPVVVGLITGSPGLKTRSDRFRRALRRELGITGFPFAITVAVGGGAALAATSQSNGVQQLLLPRSSAPRQHTVSKAIAAKVRAMPNLTPFQKTFLSNVLSSAIALSLLQRIRQSKPGSHRPSPTFELTLLFACRAIDAIMQHFLSMERTTHSRNIPAHHEPSEYLLSAAADGDHKAKEWHQTSAASLDVILFWACSARIMWCFFYQPHRLPPSYVKWISSLAGLDKRLLDVLHVIRSKEWIYGHSSAHSHLMKGFAKDCGYPLSWGDPQVLPAFGGVDADVVWKELGVHGRGGVGGLPCEFLHSRIAARWGLDNSCLINVGIRFSLAFAEAMALYLPAHFLPILLTRPRSVLRRHRAIPALLAAIRSATFLSTFISSYFFSVCITRTLVLAKLFPWIPHDVWDGPYGCVLMGSLTCGWSVLIENTRRRGEMALYVLPKALRASLPKWITTSGHTGARLAERVVFVLSLASLLTFAIHEPSSLRGLSRWTLNFVMKGPDSGFWKKRKEVTTFPSTPSPDSTTQSINGLKDIP